MHGSHAIDRRLLIAFITLVLSFGAFALLHPHGAKAAPCLNCPPPPGGGVTSTTVTHTLTVNRPTVGTITSAPTHISCPAGSGGTCSASDSQTVGCDDVQCEAPDPDAWDTYTLTASGGPSGFGPHWSDDCSGSSCSVKLDANKTVSFTWVDVTNPNVSVSPGSVKVGRLLNASAAASDNAGVSKVEFYLDGVLKATDTSAPYSASIPMDGYAQGSTHSLKARAYDTSNHISDSSTSTVTVDKVVNLTVGALPAYTNALTVPLTIGTDPDASMKCSLDAVHFSTCAGTYSPLSSPADGSYTYSVTATDDVGNVASATRTFIVDRTAPSASFTDGPFDGATVSAGDVTESFDYSDANPLTVECAVDGGAYGPCSAAHSQTFHSVAAGSAHQLQVRVTDAAGNVTQLVRHFSVTPAPTPGGNTNAGGGSGGSQAIAPRLHTAKLSSGFKLKGKNTLVRKLVVTGLPSGAKVKVRCSGHGCPFRSKKFKAKHGKVNLSKAFRNRKLRKGAKLEIDITIPGGQKQVFKLTTRAGKKPLQRAS